MSIPVASNILKDAISAFVDGVTVDPWEYVTLSADSSISTTTLGNTGNLSFTALANTVYEVEVLGYFTSAATTTGIGAALDIPSGVVNGQGWHPVSATALGSFEQVADAAVTGATTGVRAATTNVPVKMAFLVAVSSTGGTVQLQHRSEIASSAVIMKAGTILKYRKASSQPGLQRKIKPMTSAAYTALGTKDPSTLYVIVTTPPIDASYKWVALSAAEYAAIGTKDPEVLYVVMP
jgi:hypothetical protein